MARGRAGVVLVALGARRAGATLDSGPGTHPRMIVT
jgi:hypothetical protein